MGSTPATPSRSARLREVLVWGFFALVAAASTVLDVLYFHLWR